MAAASLPCPVRFMGFAPCLRAGRDPWWDCMAAPGLPAHHQLTSREEGLQVHSPI